VQRTFLADFKKFYTFDKFAVLFCALRKGLAGIFLAFSSPTAQKVKKYYVKAAEYLQNTYCFFAQYNV